MCIKLIVMFSTVTSVQSVILYDKKEQGYLYTFNMMPLTMNSFIRTFQLSELNFKNSGPKEFR